MSRKATDAEVFEDQDVMLRHVVWLPGAGLRFGSIPPALTELLLEIMGEEKPAILDELPALGCLLGREDVDDEALAQALADTPGFLIQVETPKRKWFSDGSPRLNWGETWTEWFHVRDLSDFVPTASRFVRDCIERDGMMHPRIFENTDVETE